MTAIADRPLARPRSKNSRRLRYAARVAIVTGLTGILCVFFLSPLLYSASTAFKGPEQVSSAQAPWYPAKQQFSTYKPAADEKCVKADHDAAGNCLLPLYYVTVNGQTREMAALNQYLQKTDFIDPNDPTHAIVTVPESARSLQQVWTFGLKLENVSQVWNDLDFLLIFRNTLIIAIFGTIGAVASAILVAYAFARFRFPFRNTLFMVLIATIVLPFQVTMIPQFIVFSSIGWVGTMLPLIIPHYFANAYNVFLLRQYFMTLPRDLDEAAMMDGANPFRILLSVIIPQAWPAIIAISLFHFYFAWNDFLAPLIYLQGNSSLYPIAVGIGKYNQSHAAAGAGGLVQTASLLALILPVVLFFIAQRVFMRGVVISGVEK